MKKRLSCAGLVLGWVLLSPAGCAPADPFAPDPHVAARQVEKLIPRGMTDVQAKSRLSDRGFTLSRLSSDHATNHLIIATCTRGDHMWQVGLIVIDARVTATSVTVTDFSNVSK